MCSPYLVWEVTLAKPSRLSFTYLLRTLSTPTTLAVSAAVQRNRTIICSIMDVRIFQSGHNHSLLLCVGRNRQGFDYAVLLKTRGPQ